MVTLTGDHPVRAGAGDVSVSVNGVQIYLWLFEVLPEDQYSEALSVLGHNQLGVSSLLRMFSGQKYHRLRLGYSPVERRRLLNRRTGVLSTLCFHDLAFLTAQGISQWH
ncbi:hypothetical protein ACH42_00725 [Endozoicomonas sp. (ex Bugula neritina AB1)]|nr:hypothetical protein ACH42_00725 [Endozoicomonas sp. (ex Bugula neritina AB1)]